MSRFRQGWTSPTSTRCSLPPAPSQGSTSPAAPWPGATPRRAAIARRCRWGRDGTGDGWGWGGWGVGIGRKYAGLWVSWKFQYEISWSCLNSRNLEDGKTMFWLYTYVGYWIYVPMNTWQVIDEHLWDNHQQWGLTNSLVRWTMELVK